jgi:hypothetical protein
MMQAKRKNTGRWGGCETMPAPFPGLPHGKKNAALGCGVWRPHQLWVRGHRVRTEPARAGSVVFWGARCAAWPIVKPLPKKKRKKDASG